MKNPLILLLLSFWTFTAFTQSVDLYQNVQNLNNPIFSNPALIGWHGGVGVYSNSSSRLNGFTGSPASHTIGADGYVNKIKTAVAVNFTGQRTGLLIEESAGFVVSPKLRLMEKMYLMPALSVNFSRLSFDTRELLEAKRLYEPSNPKKTVNFQAGLAFIYKDLFISASAYENGNEFLQRNIYSFTAGYGIEINEHWNVTPTLNLVSDETNIYSRISSTVNYRFLFIAPYFIAKDEFGLSTGVTIHKRFRISGTYHTTRSRIEQNARATYEFGLQAILFKNQAKQTFLRNLPAL